MRIAYFTHSLVSDWNHGNAHFLRGVLAELISRGHEAVAWEPKRGWSRTNMLRDAPMAEEVFRRDFPTLRSRVYSGKKDLDAALDGAGLVIVHEWTAPAIVAEIGRRRARGAPFVLLFHDTHHRIVSEPKKMAAFDLSAYDGVLAFGEALSERYQTRGWGRRVWTWHEAADTRRFHPMPEIARERDIVWIGNWGDGERSAELEKFLFRPAAAAGASLDIFGVRYPREALKRLARAGARYHGWLPNARVPEVFAGARMTIHVPRRFYARALPGIPTIRVFEALACGVPLISAPWEDSEGLFGADDFLRAKNGAEATRQVRMLLHEPEAGREVADRGQRTIRTRHTCAHRVDELFSILHQIAAPAKSVATERRVA
jgi:spore maturation protein CgeB